jgi:uncharacterized protein YcbK (DUF882 family)
MGDLSEHFNHKDFSCRCNACKGEYKVHLGLVGALENIGGHFRKKVRVVNAYWCDAFSEKLNRPKPSFHTKGKAVHIMIEGIAPQDLFKFAETQPELKGIGFYPKETFIHIDTRPGERVVFVKEGNEYNLLTSEKRSRYGL